MKSETISLGISLELPLLVIDIQRGGPSTGLPTKTEAADLLMAMYGRHGESPLTIIVTPVILTFNSVVQSRYTVLLSAVL